ncbi:MAG: L,D-transpeptidase family protein [Sphingomonadales bacterium]|nr:L,D-transpeptidase family protein [Sphingomonadales bacterium]
MADKAPSNAVTVTMNTPCALAAALLLCGTAASAASAPAPALPALAAPAAPAWTGHQVDQLRDWLAAAPLEGLRLAPAPLPDGDAAAATIAALALAEGLLHGTATTAERAGWTIPADDDTIDLRGALAAALTRDELDAFFRSLRPRHPAYEVLRQALRTEPDPARRAILARNLERWRWLPRDPGPRYLLVNIPGFEASLWENGRQTGRWRVIVGKPKTPTPVFMATVTGVTLNPWWDIPPSIVAESIGKLTRTRPAEARRRGYVWGHGTWRQRPGPGNALGRMKLAMPNPYHVYLHDTPSKALFDTPDRALSHGCVRVDKPLELAAALLGRSVEAEVRRGTTTTLPLGAPVPVYITYFTADAAATGAPEYHPDIYGRDGAGGGSAPVPGCPG